MERKRAQMDVTVKLLLEAGEIRPGVAVLQVASRDKTRCGDLHADGHISFEGVRHRSLSSFAVAAIRSCGATGRKTANGWQVVSYRGRPLDQYRSEFIEKRSQDSDSTASRDDDDDGDLPSKTAADAKKRRSATTTTTIRLEDPSRPFRQSADWRDGSSSSSAVRSSESGCSRCSFSDVSHSKRVLAQTLPRRRLRPSRSWFDTLPTLTPIELRRSNPSAKPSTGVIVPSSVEHSAESIDAACGMNIAAAKAPIDDRRRLPSKEDPEEEEDQQQEEEEDQGRAVHMWLKKALNKRHREECGMT